MPEHNHSRKSEIIDLDKRFILGILLNVGFVLIEAGYGIYYNSIALLSDAGHNLSDIASLLLALTAYRMAKVKPDLKYTYGFRKTTVLVSLLNAIVLLVAMGAIVWESIGRFTNSTEINGNPIVIVSGIGIFINGFTAVLFLKDKERDLNIKGAYLHMLSDALVSLGVLIAGALILFTNWYWLDGIIGIAVALLVLFSTFRLLIDSFNLSIDAVPEGIDLSKLKSKIEQITGVFEIHHIHIWAISTTLNAFTAHVKIKDNLSWQETIKIKALIRHELIRENIHHSTLEFEIEDESCESEVI